MAKEDEISLQASYPISCVGVSESDMSLAPLKDNPATASVDVYSNGTRVVGCPYLQQHDVLMNGERGDCKASLSRAKCVHLFPLPALDPDTPIVSDDGPPF